MGYKEKFNDIIVLKGFSNQTIRSYLSVFNIIMDEMPTVIEGEKENIVSYLASKIKKQKLSASYVAQFVSVINILLNDVCGIEKKILIPRPKKIINQPDVLTQVEMQLLISSIENIKHKAIVAVMYSTGMRVNEACFLKIKDIDINNGCINIRKGKGGKDRKAILDESIVNILKKYVIEYKPTQFLFMGAKGLEYSTRSVQQIVKKAALKAGINKNISTHSLRHSCFTEMVKSGVDIRFIQRLAGHKNINTTAQYLRIADEDVLKLNSPIKSISLK